MVDRLDVWLYGTEIGELRRATGNALTLRYSDAAVRRWGRGGTPLSVALPIGTGALDATPFFAGLLPDNPTTQGRIGAQHRIDGNDRFALLGAIGRDCAGAVTVADNDRPGGEPHLQPITDIELRDVINNLPTAPLGSGTGSRVSLGGNQPKLLLTRLPDGGWAIPMDGYPSTHILKPEPIDLDGYVGDELLCMRLAARCGLASATAERINVKGREVFVIERYDRTPHDAGGQPRRIHQEDFCQALQRLPEHRFELPGERRHGDIARLILERARPGDIARFASFLTFNIAIGNADAHDKNYSLLHGEDGAIHLAPLYDATNTTVSASASTTTASSVNGKYDIHAITVSDLVAEGATWGRRTARLVGAAITETLDLMAAHLGPAASDVWVDEEIVDAISARVHNLRAGRGAGEA